ncbi:DUF488 domain-containing protein [Timonella senegalensis]|uniref:DUF488 domain-containing protein n=1 Tax=Timonella senegalensis TaxID=1465825 RepID=UPI00031B5BD7|nr:DUF488 domain-containing protein [Timonella senegalensis]
MRRGPVYTVGHSNREIGEFLGLLTEFGVKTLVDVRRLPGSNRYPWFNADALAAALKDVGIEHRRIEGLAGRRGVSKDVPDEVNAWWENRSFHNYADWALSSEEFEHGLAELVGLVEAAGGDTAGGESAGGESVGCDGAPAVAIMCAEAVWWRCHRRIVSDYLLGVEGLEVKHLMGPGKAVAAELSAGARVEGKRIEYPVR